MKIRSKYLNYIFSKNWKCIYVGLSNVQPKNAKGAGKRNYYYVFERITSDKLAEKFIRLNSSEAAKVYRGELDVETILNKRERKKESNYRRRVSYHFIGK